MKKHILYKVTYLPHLNTDLPKFYIGSKYDYIGNYFGSVSSKQEYEFTNGLCLRDWWKWQKQNPSNFDFVILETFYDITPEELVIRERELQLKLNVLSEDYFNHAIATEGFCSKKKSSQTKLVMSTKTKEYWESEDGKLKRQRLIERNRNIKSAEMKKKWSNPTEAMLNRITYGRPKGAKDVGERKLRNDTRQVRHQNTIFKNAVEAANIFNVHSVTIRRWCKLQMNDWGYL